MLNPLLRRWNFKGVSLHRAHTSAMEIDIITRQGMTTLLEKIEKVGAESVHDILEHYFCDAQVAEPAYPTLAPAQTLARTLYSCL